MRKKLVALCLSLSTLSVPSISTGYIPAISHRIVPGVFAAQENIPDAPAVLGGWKKNLNCNHSVFQPTPTPAPAQKYLDYDQLHRISRGEKQTIAILSTGVANNPRVGNISYSNDYIGTSAREDCDGIGTAVAGIISGQPSRTDRFIGIAPASDILSIRTVSSAYNLTQQNLSMTQTVQNNVNMLAKGILEAASHHATIILIPQPICYAATLPINTRSLQAIINYAVLRKHILVIAAAGDSGEGACSVGAEEDSALPETQPVSHASLVTAPAVASSLLLNVGSLSTQEKPSNFSLIARNPLVASIGEDIISLSNGESLHHLANGFEEEDNSISFFNSTAFASAYVAGIAALIRSKYPQLRALETLHRILVTAHPFSQYPSNKVGAGSIDALAALTWNVPGKTPPPPPSQQINYVAPIPPATIIPQVILVIGTVTGLVLIALGFIYYLTLRSQRSPKTVQRRR